MGLVVEIDGEEPAERAVGKGVALVVMEAVEGIGRKAFGSSVRVSLLNDVLKSR